MGSNKNTNQKRNRIKYKYPAVRSVGDSPSVTTAERINSCDPSDRDEVQKELDWLRYYNGDECVENTIALSEFLRDEMPGDFTGQLELIPDFGEPDWH